MQGIAPLILIVLAFGVIFGVVKLQSLGRRLAFMILGPVILMALFHMSREILARLTLGEQVIVGTAGALVAAVVLLRIALPRDVWAAVVGAFIHDVLKWLIRAPIRFLVWTGRLAFGRPRGSTGAVGRRAMGYPDASGRGDRNRETADGDPGTGPPTP